jgi:high-affinity iron transporter
MKFIFKITSLLAAGAAILAMATACQRAAAPDVPPATRDGGDAQRLVTVLDYVGSDYAAAVAHGQVTSELEYEEQVKFTADARAIVARLLGSGAGSDPLVKRVAEVESLVSAKADPPVVAAACRIARDAVVTRFALRTMPTERPSLPRAEALYAESCAVCHGAQGDGDTPRALLLDPRPASFRDPSRLGALSPYRVYNTLTFGIPGTAMASFDALSPAERWSLAFYVFRLGHEGQRARGPVSMPLADLASRTDQELLQDLQAQRHPAPAEGLTEARRATAFTEPAAGLGVAHTRRLLRQAVALVEEGRREDADRMVLDAYLEGFEPLEVRLRGRDAEGTAAVETGFRDLRAALSRGALADVRARHVVLDERLARVGGGQRAALPFLAAFLIYFREGVEAALLVGGLLAGVQRLGRKDARLYVHFGWILALPAGVLTWWAAERLITVTATQRELSEAVISLLAAAVLFSMSFWMISRVEARRWTGYLRRGVEETLSRRNLLLLAGLSFLAVYREAAETVLFTQALLLDHGGARSQVWMGAGVGLLAVVALGVVMSRSVTRLPMGPFFAVSSALLCTLAISFAGSGMYELVAAGYLPPRPVSFPEIPWMGIHPDLTALLVQLTILAVVAMGAVVTLRRRSREL